MEPLVAKIFQCPQCKKIMKEEVKEQIVEDKDKVEKEGFQDGEYYHSHASLNKQYEICDKGLTVLKTQNKWFAVLICHTPYLKTDKYIRLSWWKKSVNQHSGMFKIYEKEVLVNLLMSLKKIDEAFDEYWNWHGKFGKKTAKTDDQKEKEKKLDIIKYRILENKTCPKCQKKMDKMKSHYECQHCGEIVILEGYNQPIFNIPTADLDLSFQTNFPINYYMPVSGITFKWLMGEWNALVVIFSKDNPNKKWLRFYWWVRDLTNILKLGRMEMGEGTQMGWKAQKGVGSPNIAEKKEIKPLIEALEKAAKELNWQIDESNS